MSGVAETVAGTDGGASGGGPVTEQRIVRDGDGRGVGADGCPERGGDGREWYCGGWVGAVSADRRLPDSAGGRRRGAGEGLPGAIPPAHHADGESVPRLQR